jgi:hypothetical protein
LTKTLLFTGLCVINEVFLPSTLGENQKALETVEICRVVSYLGLVIIIERPQIIPLLEGELERGVGPYNSSHLQGEVMLHILPLPEGELVGVGDNQ